MTINASPEFRKILERGDRNLRLVLPQDGVNDAGMPTTTNEGQSTEPGTCVNGPSDAAAPGVATTECPLVPAERNDRDRLKPIRWSDLHRLPKREALIEGLLDCTALSLMYGPSGCGKTFFALDLAVHVALGQVWRGRAVLQGAAVYVAAEGGFGILDRLTAFSCKYGIDPKTVPLYVVPDPIDLCNSDTDLDLLLDHLRNLPNDQPVRLLIIDTASRALAGGNENSPDHMGAFVMRCDKLRSMTGAHISLLHHSGKDVNQGARGHSLLRAAVDTEIEMRWDKGTQSGAATVTKQRNMRTEGMFTFKLDEVDVSMEEEKLVSSCVVMPVDSPVTDSANKPARMTKSTQTALRALQEAVSECGDVPPASNHIPAGVKVISVDQWRNYAYRMGISTSTEDRAKQQAFKRASEHLIGCGHVGFWDGHAWPATAKENR